MKIPMALHYSKEDFLEWGKNNGLRAEVVDYLEEQDELGGATPKMWMDYSKLTSDFEVAKNKPAELGSKIDNLKAYIIQASAILGKDIYNQFTDWNVERQIAKMM